MKKIISILGIGLLIAFVLIPFRLEVAPSFAGIISVSAFSSDSTISHWNNFRTTVVNAINGAIEGSGVNNSTVNIQADSLGELDMADEINPRVRDSELLGITVDTTTASNAFVDDGLTPADTANLTSNISAGTAYINGYRVDKAATSRTYTANMDTYVDLNQSGTFVFSEVAVGAAAPAVAANAARLARVTTNGTEITTVTDLANRLIPGLIVPLNFRDGLFVSRDSTSAITVFPGRAEINNATVSKTTVTTLNLGTAGDWAGGTSLRAALTYGYVGVDTSGNLRLHTTRPTDQNYALSVKNGKLRYASWSSTTYRVLGWFFMDGDQNLAATPSQDTASVSNIREFSLPNTLMKVGTTDITSGSTFTLMNNMDISIDTSGGPVGALFTAPILDGTGVGVIRMLVDGTERVRTERADAGGDATTALPLQLPQQYLTPGTHTVRVQFITESGTDIQQRGTQDGTRVLTVWEE